MKPWREVAIPHADVLGGTFQQSEFAADLTAVRNGQATREYQDAVAFFERTFITAGMRLLLTQVAQRLNGLGGEPVIQLQTAFGGGKTHTMLAVYHLATRPGPLNDLAGIPALKFSHVDDENLFLWRFLHANCSTRKNSSLEIRFDRRGKLDPDPGSGFLAALPGGQPSRAGPAS